MAGSLQSRIKVWSSTEDVDAADLNAEFDNVLEAMQPLLSDDYSTNTAQMQVTTDPGEVGSESLATTLGGELARLRFAIKEIKGTNVDQWYESPGTDLSVLQTVLGSTLSKNVIVSGRARTGSSQPIFLVPHGAALTVTVKGTGTELVYYVNGTRYTLSADVTNTTLVAAPSTNNTALVNMPNVSGQSWTKLLGEYGNYITIDNIGSEITSLNGKICGFKVGAEYFLGKVDTSNNRIVSVNRGFFFDSTDAALPRVSLSDNDTITLMKLTWVFLKTNGTIAVSYTNPRVSATQPTSPSVGDYWFDTVNQIWKIFDSASFVDATATLVGICLQDATNCVAARAFDFAKAFEKSEMPELELISNTEVRTRLTQRDLSVYGSAVSLQDDFLRWDMALNLDSGVTEAASTTYYFYTTETGKPVISDVAPMEFGSRHGLYHPHQAWLCVGQAYNNASSNLTRVLDFRRTKNNYWINSFVSGNALTLEVHATPQNEFEFRGAVDGENDVLIGRIPAPQALTVPNTATLNHTSALAEQMGLYLIRGTDHTILGVSSDVFDEGKLQTTTLLDTGSDGDLLYSTVAQTSRPILLVASMFSTQASAGVWAAAPTRLAPAYAGALGQMVRLSEILLTAPNGHGSTNTKIRRWTNTRINRGSSITYTDSVTLGAVFTINEAGIYAISYSDASTADYIFGVSLNSGASAGTSINSLTDANIVAIAGDALGNYAAFAGATRYFRAGDELRCHDDGSPDTTSNSVGRFHIKRIG